MENTIVTKKDCGPDKILNVKTNRCLKKKKNKKMWTWKISQYENKSMCQEKIYRNRTRT